mgnify:CR=1 FL=1
MVMMFMVHPVARWFWVVVFLAGLGTASAHSGYENETAVRLHADRMDVVVRTTFGFAWKILGHRAPGDIGEAAQQIAKPLLTAVGRWDEEKILSRFTESFLPDQISILTEDATPIGWMQISETAEEIHLDQLHLVQSVRNQGIGTRLIKELQNRAAACRKMLALNVMRGNHARQLYERLGFREVGSDEDKIRMLWQPAGKAPVARP